MSVEPAFYSDKDVAGLLGMSDSWVRVQRLKRSHGEPHFLDLDPRYIGRSVRYVRREVDDFVASLAA